MLGEVLFWYVPWPATAFLHSGSTSERDCRQNQTFSPHGLLTRRIFSLYEFLPCELPGSTGRESEIAVNSLFRSKIGHFLEKTQFVYEELKRKRQLWCSGIFSYRPYPVPKSAPIGCSGIFSYRPYPVPKSAPIRCRLPPSSSA